MVEFADVLLHVVTIGATAVAALKIRRKPAARPQCTASLANDDQHTLTDQCNAQSDQRCQGGQCTFHCRKHCGGKCLE